MSDVGFRFEHSVKRDSDAVNVITYEIWELNNIDVIEYFTNTLYKVFSENTIYKINCLKETMGKGGHCPAYYSEQDVRNIITKAVNEILEYHHISCKSPKVLWLCDTAEDVFSNYHWLHWDDEVSYKDFSKELSVWSTGIKIADCSEEGSLYLYSEREFEVAQIC